MNSSLLLLNTLALAVLVIVHFQPQPASAEQGNEMAGIYNKPLTPPPTLAIMTSANHASPQLAEQPAALPQGEHWVF